MISGVSKVEKCRQMKRYLVQKCHKNKEKPVMELPGMKGGRARQFIESTVLRAKRCISGWQNVWLSEVRMSNFFRAVFHAILSFCLVLLVLRQR